VPAHSDPEDLALRALGEDVAGLDDHLATCALCRDELEALRAVVATGRAVTAEDRPVAPPPVVWDRVVAELGLSVPAVTGAPDPATPAGSPAVRDELAARRERSGRGRTALVAAAAALVGIALGVGGGAVLGGSDDGSGAVVATASLAALPDRSGTGEATLRTADGERVLVLDVSGLTTADGFYEVWLLDEDAQRLVSLGLLDGSTGRFTLPPAVDVGEFPVVDVSIEPADGDPAHSGDSVVRGTLSS
jgi:hypothetical protein